MVCNYCVEPLETAKQFEGMPAYVATAGCWATGVQSGVGVFLSAEQNKETGHHSSPSQVETTSGACLQGKL